MRASARSLTALVLAISLLVTMAVTSVLAAGGGRTFTIALTGAAEPNGGDPNASGTGRVTINVGLGTLCYDISWTGIGGESAADDLVWGGHIHNAPAGVNGGIFVHLFGGPPAANNTAYPGTFSVADCMDVDRAMLLAIVAQPQNYYLNLHNGEFPGGVIRGQLR